MKKRNLLVLTALTVMLAVAALPAAAESIEQYVGGAIELSPTVQAKTAAVRRAEARLSEVSRPSLFTYQLGTGATRATFGAESATTFDVAPEATVELASPWRTSLGVSLGTTLTLDDAVEHEVSPSVSLKQPFSELLFDLPDDVTERERYNALIQTRVALDQERDRTATQVYTALQTLAERSHRLRSAERDLRLAQDDEADARQLGTYDESSAQFQNLLLQVRLAKESVTYAEAMLGLQEERVARLTGIAPTASARAVPAAPEWREAPAVAEADPSATTAVQLAELTLDLEQLRYTQEYGDLPPSLVLEGRAVSRDVASDGVVEYEGSLTAAWDDLTVSAGGGVTPERDQFYFTAEVTWTPGTASTEEYGRAAQSVAVRQAALDVEDAVLSIEESLIAHRATFAEQDQRHAELRERLAYAELELEETRARAERGLVDAATVEEAEWNVRAIEHEADLLAWSRLIAIQEYEQTVEEQI